MPRDRKRSSAPSGPEDRGERSRPQHAGQRPPRRDGDSRRGREAAPSGNLIWGYHPVLEALRSSRRRFGQMYATTAAAERLQAEITARKLTPDIVQPAELDRILPAGAVHQGLALRVEPLPQPDLSELPADGFVLVLDQITDPHNLGAIIRTAAAFAVSAIVLTERNAPPLAGVVAKSASGGLEHVPVIAVVNLARAMEELGSLGYWRIGLDSDGEASLDDMALTRPLALVLGAEGKGLRRLTRENCDAMARLDMPGAIKSLNVSNACAAALTMVRLRTAQS
ncbi:MAG: 23S rRNA (guanosine(2251)-2'-O)-methyltransferase RlmB [Beijerinckiaceae bacterium]